jgi:hypothetical protein
MLSALQRSGIWAAAHAAGPGRTYGRASLRSLHLGGEVCRGAVFAPLVSADWVINVPSPSTTTSRVHGRDEEWSVSCVGALTGSHMTSILYRLSLYLPPTPLPRSRLRRFLTLPRASNVTTLITSTVTAAPIRCPIRRPMARLIGDAPRTHRLPRVRARAGLATIAGRPSPGWRCSLDPVARTPASAHRRFLAWLRGRWPAERAPGSVARVPIRRRIRLLVWARRLVQAASLSLFLFLPRPPSAGRSRRRRRAGALPWPVEAFLLFDPSRRRHPARHPHAHRGLACPWSSSPHADPGARLCGCSARSHLHRSSGGLPSGAPSRRGARRRTGPSPAAASTCFWASLGRPLRRPWGDS